MVPTPPTRSSSMAVMARNFNVCSERRDYNKPSFGRGFRGQMGHGNGVGGDPSTGYYSI